MPRNRVMYLGVLVVAASALLYLGGMLIKLIEWFLPWSAGAGVALILIGLWMELQKNKKPKPVNDKAATEAQAQASQTGEPR